MSRPNPYLSSTLAHTVTRLLLKLKQDELMPTAVTYNLFLEFMGRQKAEAESAELLQSMLTMRVPPSCKTKQIIDNYWRLSDDDTGLPLTGPLVGETFDRLCKVRFI